MKSSLVDIDAVLVHQTEKAYFVHTENKNGVWLPKSMCEYNADDKTVTMEESFAIEKELI
jgi:hypothetical protein